MVEYNVYHIGSGCFITRFFSYSEAVDFCTRYYGECWEEVVEIEDEEEEGID